MRVSTSLPLFACIALLAATTAPAQTAPAPALTASLDSPALSSSSSSSFEDASAAASAAGSAAVSLPPRPIERNSLPFSGLATSFKVGIAGFGVDVATPIVPTRLNLRAGASFLAYTPSTFQVDSLNIDGKIKFQNSNIMLDYFPFRGRFRISGGMSVYNHNELSATLNAPGGTTFTLGDTQYYSDPSNPITGSGTFNFGGKIAPRATIGTGNLLPKKGRFTFQSEIGFQYISQPTVDYTFSGNGCQSYNGIVYSNCGPISQTDVASEEQQIRDDLKPLRFYPILSFGFGFRLH